jgi:tetratricopeptide (TPR) repeat protein
MDSGIKSLQAGEYERAIVLLRQASLALPKDPEPLYQLARAYVAGGKVTDFPKAVEALRKALRADPQHRGARLDLARLQALTSETEALTAAEQELHKLLADSANDSEALNILATAQWKLGKFSDAMTGLSAALQRTPGDLRSTMLLVVMKLRKRDFAGAEEVARNAIAAAPESPEPMILLARVYFMEGKLTETVLLLKQALALSPDLVTASVLLGETQVRLNQMEDAEATFKRIAGLNDKEFRHAYALFLFDRGRRDEAVRELERLARTDPADRTARSRLVSGYYLTGRRQDAMKLLGEAVRANRNDGAALLQRAELLASYGKYTDAEADLDALPRVTANSAEAHFVRARVAQARGQDLTYRQELAETLRLRPDALSVRIELAEVLRRANGANAALAILDEAPPRQRRTADLLTARNWVLWTLNNFQEMRKGIDLALSITRNSELLAQDGYWRLQAGDPRAADASFEAALKLDPDNLPALEGVWRAAALRKSARTGVERIKVYASKRPTSAKVQQFLGQVLADSGDKEGARAAWSAAKLVEPNTIAVDLALVKLDIEESKLEQAVGRLRAIVADDPRSSTARLWLGNLEITKGNVPAAMEEYRQAVQVDPRNASALNNLAYLLSEQGRNDEALAYAEKAKELSPENGRYADTLGWILYRKGLYSGAVAALEESVVREPAEADTRYHLGMAYLSLGNKIQAKAALEAALKRNPSHENAKAARARLLESH